MLHVAIGAFCFGLVTGYVTYRTLVRTTKAAAVSDLAAVLSALGGGVVVKLFDPTADANLFGWYAIGLPVGMVVYIVTLGVLSRGGTGTARRQVATVLGAAPLPGTDEHRPAAGRAGASRPTGT